MPADPPFGRPAVLQRLDVEEDADQRVLRGRFVAVTIATVSTVGSRSAMRPSTRAHELGFAPLDKSDVLRLPGFEELVELRLVVARRAAVTGAGPTATPRISKPSVLAR